MRGNYNLARQDDKCTDPSGIKVWVASPGKSQDVLRCPQRSEEAQNGYQRNVVISSRCGHTTRVVTDPRSMILTGVSCFVKDMFVDMETYVKQICIFFPIPLPCNRTLR